MSNAGGAAVGAEHVGARRRRQVARRLREDLREQGSDVPIPLLTLYRSAHAPMCPGGRPLQPYSEVRVVVLHSHLDDPKSVAIQHERSRCSTEMKTCSHTMSNAATPSLAASSHKVSAVFARGRPFPAAPFDLKRHCNTRQHCGSACRERYFCEARRCVCAEMCVHNFQRAKITEVSLRLEVHEIAQIGSRADSYQEEHANGEALERHRVAPSSHRQEFAAVAHSHTAVTARDQRRKPIPWYARAVKAWAPGRCSPCSTICPTLRIVSTRTWHDTHRGLNSEAIATWPTECGNARPPQPAHPK